MIYFNNYLYDPKRPQLPEHPSNKPGATPTGPHPSGLPLPTPMAPQPLLTRPSLWPSSMLIRLITDKKTVFNFNFSVCTSSSRSSRLLSKSFPSTSSSKTTVYVSRSWWTSRWSTSSWTVSYFSFSIILFNFLFFYFKSNRPLRSYEDLDAPNEI